MRGIRKTEPYTAGEQPNFTDMIKLNTNENPYPPSPKVKKALQDFDYDQLKRYSSLDQRPLKEALAEKFQLAPENFIIGNGSDEVLAFCFLAFFNSEYPVLFPDITYGFYPVWGDLFKVPIQLIPLRENFKINLADYKTENGGVILTNPNAPTGDYLSVADIEKFLQANTESVVVVDEAYIDFGGTSVMPLIDNYPNLVVVHTLSKGVSLAGLRVGYAVAQPTLIQVLEGVKSSFNPYSVDSLAETLATAAIEDGEYYQNLQTQISATREAFSKDLLKLDFEVLPSLANFVFAKPTKISAEKLFNELKAQHVFVRYFKQERLKDYLRISIGTPSEMTRVTQIIQQLQLSDD
ncbi:histidinol-phosphate transaminase [Enterococcus sp. HY326]|uniref:histidinol-phosphate transaminase n=1 Tax=Enterococcus sp. HY326 TaxID=2971265 RepID=UPI00223F6108|nr:histidinol-phosphate transaminase [Enterococcus sp. HY326]